MSAHCEVTARKRSGARMSLFERYLTLWVFLCIVAGISLGHWLPVPFQVLGRLELAQVNLPVAVLIWLMIVPMLLKIDFSALSRVREPWRGAVMLSVVKIVNDSKRWYELPQQPAGDAT